jgi:hypothetical protein
VLRFFFACFHVNARQEGGGPVFIPRNGLKKKRYLVFLFAYLIIFQSATISVRHEIRLATGSFWRLTSLSSSGFI